MRGPTAMLLQMQSQTPRRAHYIHILYTQTATGPVAAYIYSRIPVCAYTRYNSINF